MKLWQRTLFFRLLKSFLFILLSIFLLFVMLDLATHSGKLLGARLIPRYETLLYYIYQFSNYLGLFFPLSFLLASIHLLLDLNSHHELTALQMGGLSRKKLLGPFFLLASLLFLIALANLQWIAPKALASASEYTLTYAHHKKVNFREHLQTFSLDNGTELIFQQFDPQKKELFDVFWIENPSKIWHMKYLEIGDLNKGRFVDSFERADSHLEKTASFDSLSFPQIQVDPEILFQPFIPYEQRTLTQLSSQILIASAEQQSLLSHLFYKLSFPLFLFLSLLLIAPICFRFSRSKSTFKIVAFSLFGFLSTLMIFDGLLILGENQVLPAIAAFGLPLLLILSLSYRPFKNL